MNYELIEGESYTLRQVPVGELPDVDETPAPELRASMRALGYHPAWPVVLRQNGSVVFGRRRIAAAKLELPPEAIAYAVIVPNDAPMAALLVLRENLTRKRNIPAEADAVRTLVRAGRSRDQIIDELLMSEKQIGDLYTLTLLPRSLWAALQNHTLAPSVAHAITRLPATVVRVLADAAEQGEKITGAMVRDARTALRQREIAGLPTDMFAPMPESIAIEIIPEETPAEHLRNVLGVLRSTPDINPVFRSAMERRLTRALEQIEAAPVPTSE